MTIAPPEPGRVSGTATAAVPGLPGSIRVVLRGVDRRLRAAAAMRGLGAMLVVAATVAAAAMAVDLIRPLSGKARWVCWLAWVGAAASMLVVGVLRPALRRHRRDELAALAGRSRADRGQSLAAAVALVESGERAHGAPGLIAALVDRAAAEASAIDPRRAVPLTRSGRWLAIGLAAAGLVVLPSVVAPDPFGSLAIRLLAPWSDRGSAGLLRLAVEPGDAVVARGAPLAISAAVRPRVDGPLPLRLPDSALLEWTDADGSSHALEMGAGPGDDDARGDGRTFSITLPAVVGPLAYRISAGSARSRTYRVEAVDPPRIASHRWTIAPPSYTGRPAEELRDPTRAVAWQDSRVTIVASTDRPARRVSLVWPVESTSGGAAEADEPIALVPSAGGTSWTAEVVASGSGTFTIEAEDEHGLIGRPGRSGRLEVLPDAPPVVALADRADAAGPADRLSLPVAARDDLAVASAELHYAIARAGAGPDDPPERGDRPIALSIDGLGSPAARGVITLDLAPLGLRDGDTLSARVRVLDNRPPPRGPNEGWSRPMPVAIVANARAFDADRLDALLRPIREELQSLARLAAENQRRHPPNRSAAEAARRTDDAWSDARAADLDRLAEAARDLVDRLQVLSRGLEDDPTLGPLAGPVRQAAEAEAEAAREALDDARRDDGADRRLDDLRRAEADLAATSRRLDDLNRQLNSLARAAAARPELADLAGREAELADLADALAEAAEAATPDPDPAEPDAPPDPQPPVDPEALRQLRDAQEQVSRALSDLMRRAPALQDDADAAEARADAESARRDLNRADPGRPADAAESARAAAESMRQAAEELRRASGPADPSSQAERLARLLAGPAPSPSDPADGAPAVPPAGSMPAGPSDPAADLGLRGDRSWGDLPGHLRTELLQSSPDRYRPDYAAIIRLYFREIAQGASTPPPPPPPPDPAALP